MQCKEFVFLRSSGQLSDCPPSTRLAASEHQLKCGNCLAFAANDNTLTKILLQMRERAKQSRSD